MTKSRERTIFAVMKVSILTPIYGVERYIEQCLRTLFEQTYQDIEYIFVNDCTPDNSIDVLRRVMGDYPDRAQQVHIIDHQENQGLGGARITSLSNATGEAILIVDSDDYIHPNAVELLVKKMEETQADIVDGGFAYFTDDTIIKQFIPPHVSAQSYAKIILCQSVEPTRIWGRLIKRSLFTDHGITFQTGIDYGEDFSVLPRLLIQAKSRATVDQTLYYYRVNNPDSYTNNISPKNAKSFLDAQQVVAEYVSSDPLWKEYQKAAEIGWVNVWRFARRFDVKKTVVTQHFNNKPSLLTTRLLTSIMKSAIVPYSIADWCYRAVRRLYLASLR